MRIKKTDACAILIDVQEKLLPVMSNNEKLLERCKILIAGLNLLKIPTIVSEQYPKGLGHTVQQLKQLLPNQTEAIEKISFSCMDNDIFQNKINWLNTNQVIIFGIEAHVCVLQTVVDLIEIGKTPIVIIDCISSRNETDKEIAIERMKSEGAIFSTSEAILFELCRKAGTPEFKEISQLVK